MLKNVGVIDQTIRIIVGVGLLTAACFVHGWWCLIAVPPVILVFTGLMARCPAYLPLRIRTNRA